MWPLCHPVIGQLPAAESCDLWIASHTVHLPVETSHGRNLLSHFYNRWTHLTKAGLHFLGFGWFTISTVS